MKIVTDDTTPKKGTKVKRTQRVTKAVKEYVLDQIASGKNLAAICRAKPDLPTPRSIRRAQLSDKEFGESMDEAYTLHLMCMQDEYDEISREDWVIDNLPRFNGEYKLAFEARRAKQNQLSLILTRLAPILSKRYDKTTKIEVSATIDTSPSLNIISYSKLEDTKVIDVTPIKD